MFWLPYGWFPYYVEWLISFPAAPMGSVSVVSWQLACTGVISLVADAIGAIIQLVFEMRQNYTTRQKKQRMKREGAVPAEKTGTQTQAQGEKEGIKREL